MSLARDIADLGSSATRLDTEGANFKNLIINGGMQVAQRGTSHAAVSNLAFTLDRFSFSHSQDGAFTVTQDSSSPDGFGNSLKLDVTTADSSLAAGQYLLMEHKIEAQNLQQLAFGTSSAKNFTLSFYVKSNKTGTYAVNIMHEDNSSILANLTYTINSANTWERKTLTFTGDTTGAINDDNGSGFKMGFALAMGSTYTSGDTSASFRAFANANYGAGQTVNILDSTSNEWLITGIQLEVGTEATDFEHRTFDDERERCERYFQKWDVQTTLGAGLWFSANQVLGHLGFRKIMRTSPTMSVSSADFVKGYLAGGASNSNDSSSPFDEVNINAARFNLSMVSTGTNGQGCLIQLNSSEYIYADAEL